MTQEELQKRKEEVQNEFGNPDVLGNPQKIKELSYSRLQEILMRKILKNMSIRELM